MRTWILEKEIQNHVQWLSTCRRLVGEVYSLTPLALCRIPRLRTTPGPPSLTTDNLSQLLEYLVGYLRLFTAFYDDCITDNETRNCWWCGPQILEAVTLKLILWFTNSGPFYCLSSAFCDISGSERILLIQCLRQPCITQFEWVCINNAGQSSQRRLMWLLLPAVGTDARREEGGQGKEFEGFGEIRPQEPNVGWVRKCVCEFSILDPFGLFTLLRYFFIQIGQIASEVIHPDDIDINFSGTSATSGMLS